MRGNCPIHRRYRRVRKVSWTLLAATTPWIVGCNDGLSTVSGTVTLDGQPIAVGDRVNGVVNFLREDGSGASASAALDRSGRYWLTTGSRRGVEPGNYRVTVAVTETIMPDDPNAMPVPKLLTPAKYGNTQNSGLRAEVKPGSNTFDFALSSQPGE
jgi:hypothetical protein